MDNRLNPQHPGVMDNGYEQKVQYPSKTNYQGGINTKRTTPPFINPERLINVQDAFLNYVRRNKVQVTLFLMNGVKMIGFVVCFDQNTILIRKEGYAQLIYKHAISTICPHSAVNLFEWNVANKRELDLDDDLASLTQIAEEMKER